MFGIIAERIKNPDNTIRYIFKMQSIKFSDHVKYDIPVTSAIWSNEIKTFVNRLPNICNPITNNIQPFIESSSVNNKNRALGESSINTSFYAWSFQDTFNFFTEHVLKHSGMLKVQKSRIDEKRYQLDQLSVNTIDAWGWISERNNTTSPIRNGICGFYQNAAKRFLSHYDLVPDHFTYSDILNTARNRLKENWTQFNIARLCASIACLDGEPDFRGTRKAIYDIKPELKGTIKKIEDLNELDPEIFTLHDFSHEDHEYHIINLMMNPICYDSDFAMSFLKTFKQIGNDLISMDSVDNYLAGEEHITAFLCVNYEGIYKQGNYNSSDYQIFSDLAFNNSWIIEYSSNAVSNNFLLYPCFFSNDAKAELQSELSAEQSFNQIDSIEEAKKIDIASNKKYAKNSISSDVGKISALIGRELDVSFPIGLSADEIDIVINDSSASKRWTLCSDGKRYNSTNVPHYRRSRDHFLTKEISTNYTSQVRVVPSAQIDVENAETSIFEVTYHPIFGNDMTIVEIKNLIKSMGYSSVNGTKDELKKRFTDCMVKHYEKNKDELAKVFYGMKMICIIEDDSISRGSTAISGMNLLDIIDEYAVSKIIPASCRENLDSGLPNKILACMLICFIKTHNYADSIFSPDFENKMITPKGCMEDLVLRSWGQGIVVKLIETSGDF